GPLTGDVQPTLHASSDPSSPFQLRSAALFPYFIPVGIEPWLGAWPSREAVRAIGLDRRETPELAILFRQPPATLTGRYEVAVVSTPSDGDDGAPPLLWRSDDPYPTEAVFPV